MRAFVSDRSTRKVEKKRRNYQNEYINPLHRTIMLQPILPSQWHNETTTNATSPISTVTEKDDKIQVKDRRFNPTPTLASETTTTPTPSQADTIYIHQLHHKGFEVKVEDCRRQLKALQQKTRQLCGNSRTWRSEQVLSGKHQDEGGDDE